MIWFRKNKKTRFTGRCKAPRRWKLDQPLIHWSKKEAFSISQSFEGYLALGSTGAGKTSFTESIAIAMLRAGYGGYVSTFKSDEPARWRSYARQSGRERSLILFGPGHPWRFNFLNYELSRPGAGAGHVENIVALLNVALEIAKPPSVSGSDGRDGGEFWSNTKLQALRNFLDLLILATGFISVSNLYRLIMSAPQSKAEWQSPEWQAKSFCFQCLNKAEANAKTRSQIRTLELVVDYIVLDFCNLNPRTRSIVVSSVTSMLDLLNRSIASELLCGDTNITPEDMDDGAILVMDLGIAEYGQLGKLVQGIIRYCFQTSAQRRAVTQSTRPIFFFADEFQHFIIPSHDQIFQTTCRSARIATVYLTQNIPNIVAALGGNSLGKAQCDSLLANINHKLFFCNSCSVTNEYAANLIGRTRQFMLNASHSHSTAHWLDIMGGYGSQPTQNAGMNEIWEYEVQPSAFTTLKSGGFANKGQIEAVVVRNSRPFADTGRLWRLTQYQQNLRAKPF